MKKIYYSQYGQDEWLEKNLFSDLRDGFFVEVGADDGVDKSNTLYFEQKGWKGLCIEPSPSRFKLLEKNRKCICENVAISNTVGETKFLDIQGWGKGLSGIVDSYNEEHTERIKFELSNPKNKGSEFVKVKTDTLENIFNKHSIKKIDFCSIDVEGGEINVLKSINFDKVEIEVIMVENNYNDPTVREFLEKYGYELIERIEIDDIYISR